MERVFSIQEQSRKHHRRHFSFSLERQRSSCDNPSPAPSLGVRVKNLYHRARFSNGFRVKSFDQAYTNSVFSGFCEQTTKERMEDIERREDCSVEEKIVKVETIGKIGGGLESLSEFVEEKARESSSSSDFLASEATRNEEQSLSSAEDSSSPASLAWSVKKESGRECTSPESSVGDKEKPTLGAKKLEKEASRISEIEMMKERFSKLLLGEDMSGSGNGVCTALAISNAITNLCATLFGQLWRLEPMPLEKKAMWRREMEWLLCVSDHIVEMMPTWQTFPDGTKLEVMTCRPRSDLYVNLPALRKLDNMLLDILDGFDETEFWYVDQGILAPEAGGSTSFRKALQRQEEKWWLPVPCVPPNGLHENSRKHLQHKRDCTNQILKAAMAINSITLADMEIPEPYLESLPKNGRACLGDLIYRYISSEQFTPECLLDCMDLSSEHQAIEIANRVEASIYMWRKRTNLKQANTTSRSSSRSSWEMVKDLMVDGEKRELLADRAESLLLSLKQRFPGLPQTALDMSKIQYNKDVGKSILEGYSRVLESLAFNIVARIDDLLYVDDLTKNSDQYTKVGLVGHKSVSYIATSPYRTAYSTPSFSPIKGDRSPFISSGKIRQSGLGVKKVLTDYLPAAGKEVRKVKEEKEAAVPSPPRPGIVSLQEFMKESLSSPSSGGEDTDSKER